MNKEEYKPNNQIHSSFECDECKCTFEIGSGGFLGSLDEFEFQMNKEEADALKQEQSQFECSPFMNFVSLCNMCFQKTKQ